MLLDALTLLCLLTLSVWILYVPSPASLNLLIVVSLSTAAGAIGLTLLPQVRSRRLPTLMNIVTGCLYASLLALMIVAGSKMALGASISHSVLMLGALTSAVMASRQIFMLFDKRHDERFIFAHDVATYVSEPTNLSDKVTALPLRNALVERLNDLTFTPAMNRLALLILDLDDFRHLTRNTAQRSVMPLCSEWLTLCDRSCATVTSSCATEPTNSPCFLKGSTTAPWPPKPPPDLNCRRA